MIDLNEATVTSIQFFNHSFLSQVADNDFETVLAYSANIVINDSLIFQLSGVGDEAHTVTIPTSDQQYYNREDVQDWAAENIELDEAAQFLEQQDIENNFNFLIENGEAIF